MNRPPMPGESPGVFSCCHEAGREPGVAPSIHRVVAALLAGVTIRIPLLAVPPVIPLIHDDLHMSETRSDC